MSGILAAPVPQQTSPSTANARIVEAGTAASSSSRSKVLLPVEVIRSLKLQTGDAVLVTPEEYADGSFIVGTVWPSFALEAGTVRLPVAAQAANGLQSGQAVSVIPLVSTQSNTTQRRPPTAATIQLSIYAGLPAVSTALAKLSKSDRQMLTIHAKECLIDLECIHKGQQLSTSFQGNLFSFKVSALIDVNGQQGWSVTPSTSQSSQISSKLATHVCIVSRTTEVNICASDTLAQSKNETDSDLATDSSREDPYSKLGGLESQIAEIKTLIEMPLMSPEIFIQYGLKPPKGVLLYGPPGTGKTSLARAVAAATGSSYLTINGPELSSAFHGETESKLRSIFKEARRKSPCIIIIDEIDALAPRREGGSGEGANADGAGEVERRVVAQLLTLLDGMEEQEDDDEDAVQEVWAQQECTVDSCQGAEKSKTKKGPARVIILAATNRPNAIDPALRRPGRLDREIEIGIPTAAARGDIIRTLIRPVPHDLSPDQITELAGRTHGYVGADLSALVREAGMRAVRRTFARRQSTPFQLEAKIQSMSLEPAKATDVEGAMLDKVTAADLHAALSLVRPSAMREIFVEPPKVYWSDIAGSSTPSAGGSGALSTKSVQAQVRELVEWPIKHSATFFRLGISPPRGVLLYGPPGCSKTLIARALATESGLNFLAVKGPELYSKYVGESERAIRDTFKKARAAAPSIIFFDEIDALSSSRDSSGGDALNSRIIATLLNEMDGIEAMSDVIVIGATNRPQSLDPALLRPGRLDRLVYVGPPDHEARKQILRTRMAKMAVNAELVDLEKIGQMTEGCSGAEVVSICQEAGLLAMDEDINCQAVEQRHFESAASSVKRRITSLMIRQYENWRDTLAV